jgi:transcriptional antiterminator NusG
MADKFKFALAVLLLVAGIAGFYLLANQAMILRVLAVLAGTGLAAGVAWKTEPGRLFFDFAKESTNIRSGDGSLSLVDRQEPGVAPVRYGSWVEKSMSMRWYVVHAYSGFEKSVQRALLERIQRQAMQHAFGRILVPVEEVVELKMGQKSISERKFFPGYVLVEMEMNDDSWHLVKSTPKVTGFVGGTANKPTPISEKEVEKIMQQMQDGVDKPRPKVLFEPGEVVRVKDGPFTDFHGAVEQVNYEKNRLRVSVTIFGRPTPVELEFGQVEKA